MVGLLAFVVSIILFIAGLVANAGLVAILGVLLFVLGLGLLIAAGMMSPRAEVRKLPQAPTDRVVVLRRVHPNFAEAVPGPAAGRRGVVDFELTIS
jgi:hypothetical protein